jgi:pSer/pThr/pTyr-binding forkhead associated (FHA) protein
LRASKGAPAPAAAAGPLARLALIRPDGSEGGSFDVMEPEITLGRGAGPLFDNDAYLSPQHARMVFSGADVLVEDLGSLNGIYVRIVEPEPLHPGDVIRVGQELLRYDPITDPAPLDDGTEVLGSPNPGYWGRLSLIVSRTADGSAFPLMGDEMDLGRERGDILFSDDGYVSGKHAKIYLADNGVFLSDLGSSNGSFIRLAEPRRVPYGTYLLIGQQLFRLEKA